MYIHWHLDLLNLAERYLSLVLRQEKHRVPLFLSSVDSQPRSFHDEGRRGISDYHLGRGTDCRVLLSAPFLSISCQVPVLVLRPLNLLALLAPLARPTSVMMNGVAGGGIYPEIQHPGGIY